MCSEVWFTYDITNTTLIYEVIYDSGWQVGSCLVIATVLWLVPLVKYKIKCLNKCHLRLSRIEESRNPCMAKVSLGDWIRRIKYCNTEFWKHNFWVFICDQIFWKYVCFYFSQLVCRQSMEQKHSVSSSFVIGPKMAKTYGLSRIHTALMAASRYHHLTYLPLWVAQRKRAVQLDSHWSMPSQWKIQLDSHWSMPSQWKILSI